MVPGKEEPSWLRVVIKLYTCQKIWDFKNLAYNAKPTLSQNHSGRGFGKAGQMPGRHSDSLITMEAGDKKRHQLSGHFLCCLVGTCPCPSPTSFQKPTARNGALPLVSIECRIQQERSGASLGCAGDVLSSPHTFRTPIPSTLLKGNTKLRGLSFQGSKVAAMPGPTDGDGGSSLAVHLVGRPWTGSSICQPWLYRRR